MTEGECGTMKFNLNFKSRGLLPSDFVCHLPVLEKRPEEGLVNRLFTGVFLFLSAGKVCIRQINIIIIISPIPQKKSINILA